MSRGDGWSPAEYTLLAELIAQGRVDAAMRRWWSPAARSARQARASRDDWAIEFEFVRARLTQGRVDEALRLAHELAATAPEGDATGDPADRIQRVVADAWAARAAIERVAFAAENARADAAP